MTTPAPAHQVALPRVPGLGGLYGRGAVASARLAVRGGVRPTSRALPDVTYVVDDVHADADHLTAYQRLLHEPATDALPAGYVHVLGFPVAMALMVRPDFPLPLLGMVHLANRVEQRRPLALGDRLRVRAWARDLRPHRSGTQVDLVTEVAEGGDVAWLGVSTYLAKGVRVPDAPRDESPRPEFTPPVRTGRWELPADVGRRYAAVSGDRNPIHLSPVTARVLGFPRAIAHGMYTASRALADVGAARGDAFTWSVEFAAPVLLPATPDVRVAREGDGHAFTVWHPRSGRLHLTGEVTPLNA
ncbi:MaoC domain protein dehydratase [Cellulomonas flavigena DSM 20109]|uniref:MaoC domain protein dehydratase n=1 Tax=Cellulomonas flavigena (strain ATCC 482 / DSM 20109 / BCRC 11376 / JCM 18109 / NBRC 3775 / NCIMB 8073 / NRS 134) TaxID=446466 RepID=D5UKG1_CELFN|nr:MaoC/PaaZ C-terminal domain-containing protein [Cellulomonas flavigena]ADG75822.1 MaoC domain protein dehydratase [Cellulomonas flavigena DSM 20109]